jgi:hypothetical protein
MIYFSIVVSVLSLVSKSMFEPLVIVRIAIPDIFSDKPYV